MGIRSTNTSGSRVEWGNSAIVRNQAVSGGGVFVRVSLPYTLPPSTNAVPPCSGCVFANNTGRTLSTSATAIASWPVAAPVSRISVGSGLPLAQALRDPTQRPAAALVDTQLQPTTLDNTTLCQIRIASSTDDTAVVTPSTVVASAGRLSFDSVAVLARVEAELVVEATCRLVSPLSGAVTQTASFGVSIIRCPAAWDLTSARVCRRCSRDLYSPYGALCKPCPVNGDCADDIADGAAVVRFR